MMVRKEEVLSTFNPDILEHIVFFEKRLLSEWALIARSNGFRDPLTIRVDEPDFSTIAGGAGVVGGFVQDTLIVTLPFVL